MYGLIQQLDLKSSFSPAELFALLTSAVCHDLDHPGYNNSYQVMFHCCTILCSVYYIIHSSLLYYTILSFSVIYFYNIISYTLFQITMLCSGELYSKLHCTIKLNT